MKQKPLLAGTALVDGTQPAPLSAASSDKPPQPQEYEGESNTRKTFPVVGIVASAGGLDAFKKFFSAMAIDSGMAFVLIPHLDPTHESLMVELLSKSTAMPVVEAQQGMIVLVNQIYIIPPKDFLSISAGRLQLSDPPKHHTWQTSIDFFLRSLANDQGEMSIGIVLSGTGSHGALGIREIKLAGGLVIAQQPSTAEHDQMPQSAIDTGVVDFVLPPEEMPAALIKYVQQPYLCNGSAQTNRDQSPDQFDRILTLLKTRTKYDFTPYRKPMISRRIQRRMGLAHIESMSRYLGFLERHPNEVTALYKDLLISVTAFFRDPDAYSVLEQEVIPAILARQTNETAIRVWVPGCATGEEAYSIAMLLFEGAAATDTVINVQIFASDIDADAIDVARAGIYPASVAGDLSADRLKRFFLVIDEHHYQVNKQLRESVVFSHQNLIGDAPFSKMDLISCRNLLIYLEPEMQQKVISLFHFALLPTGYLLLGPSEAIAQSTDLFDTISKKWRIYRKKGTMKGDLVNIPVGRTEERQNLFSHHSPSTRHRKSFKDLTEQLVLNDYAPAAALVSRKLEVLYVTGPLVNFLEFPRGELTREILPMARPGLRTKLRAACRNAMRSGNAVIESNVRVKRGDQYVQCAIMVRPLSEPKEAKGMMLILFQDRAAGQSFGSTPDGLSEIGEPEALQSEESRLSRQLEFELLSMSEELHSTIEEMESSNEELKTSNEEIMSVNEELQSVNEELETSKEELQSLNEELNTVNSQLQEKVAELDKATDDLMNLMASTEIATIFLDEKLLIKQFTPPTKALFNLLSTDIGRPLCDIAPKFRDDDMLDECLEVLDKLDPIEREVKTVEPRYYLRRILPYRTTEHHVAGVVITFVDLTQQKRAETVQRETDARHFAELHESAERMQTILNTAADAIVTINLLGIIDSVNLATETLFDYQRDELIGQNISVLIPAIFEDHPEETLSDRIKSDLAPIIEKRRELLAQRKDGSRFPVDVAISRVDHLGLYTGILRDISVRKRLEEHILKIASDEQRRIGQELHDGTQQELTGLTLFAGALCEMLEEATQNKNHDNDAWTLPGKVYQAIKQTTEKLTRGLKEANQHINTLSHGILPVQIDSEGLRSALAELALATNEQRQIHCRFELSGSVAIASNVVATQLYRIAQESLTNALKHGNPDDILISLSQTAKQIILEICDNGVGFDQSQTSRSQTAGGGVGLRIMEYRAGMIGGTLEVFRNQGPGTTVRCTIPVTGNFS